MDPAGNDVTGRWGVFLGTDCSCHMEIRKEIVEPPTLALVAHKLPGADAPGKTWRRATLEAEGWDDEDDDTEGIMTCIGAWTQEGATFTVVFIDIEEEGERPDLAPMRAEAIEAMGGVLKGKWDVDEHGFTFEVGDRTWIFNAKSSQCAVELEDDAFDLPGDDDDDEKVGEP